MFFKNSFKDLFKLLETAPVCYIQILNNPGPQLMQFCNSSQWAFELETLRTPQDIKTPIKMLLSHGSGPTDMISVQQNPKKRTLVLGDHSWIALGGSEASFPV